MGWGTKWGVFFSLTLSSLSVSSFFMSKIRIQRTFSFSHGITGKAERVPERERESIWRCRQCGLSGWGKYQGLPLLRA